MKILCFLQNAWSPLYAGSTWPRKSWLKALWKSRSGQRLIKIVEACPDFEFWFDNTTPIVGEHPDSIITPDFTHINSLLKNYNPNVVIAFGKQAEKCLTNLFKPLIIVPHPAHRTVKNKLYQNVVNLLKNGVEKKIYIFRINHE